MICIFKGFSTSSSLNTHRRIHSGEKPHECGVCGKRFTASSNLYYHRMTHVKVLPHAHDSFLVVQIKRMGHRFCELVLEVGMPDAESYNLGQGF